MIIGLKDLKVNTQGTPRKTDDSAIIKEERVNFFGLPKVATVCIKDGSVEKHGLEGSPSLRVNALSRE